MKKLIYLFLTLLVLYCSCFNETPVWCDATLYLHIENRKDIEINCWYEPFSQYNRWKDTLTIVYKTGVDSIKLRRSSFIIGPMSSYTDTIMYSYYQTDGSCARGAIFASTLRILLNIGIQEYYIYPWDPKIRYEHVCDGCENINYDTVIVK